MAVHASAIFSLPMIEIEEFYAPSRKAALKGLNPWDVHLACANQWSDLSCQLVDFLINSNIINIPSNRVVY